MAKVRLTSAEEWPQHYMHRSPDRGWPQARGMVIVIGVPIKPCDEWICDSDVVWPVLEWDATLAQPLDNGPKAYVCRHQIEAGD